MIPFPLRWQLPRAPQNEDERLYAQAFQCLAAASWRMAAAHSQLARTDGTLLGRIDNAAFAWQVADELIEGAEVYMNLRAQLREPAPIA